MDLKVKTLTFQTGFMYCGRTSFLLKLQIHKEDKISIYLGDKLMKNSIKAGRRLQDQITLKVS